MGHWTESIFLNQASTLPCYNLRLAIIFFLGLGFPICCMGTGLFTQLCLTLCDPTDCSLSGYSLSMEFSRQESWSGKPFPSPGDLLDSGIEPGSPALQADSLSSEPPGKPGKDTKVISEAAFIACLSQAIHCSWACHLVL